MKCIKIQNTTCGDEISIQVVV